MSLLMLFVLRTSTIIPQYMTEFAMDQVCDEPKLNVSLIKYPERKLSFRGIILVCIFIYVFVLISYQVGIDKIKLSGMYHEYPWAEADKMIMD